MNESTSASAPLKNSRGVPGAAIRSRAFSQALTPFVGTVFASGWVFGAVVSPSFFQLSHVGVLLVLLALTLVVTWKRAMNVLMRHEEGARGEEQVARVLGALSEEWRSYHGVEVGDRKIDHVCVGAGQVFTIETIHWPGSVRWVGDSLFHMEKEYPGYDLATFKTQAAETAEALGIPERALRPMVCIVGGRFSERPAEHKGVWIGEIQDLGPYLLQHPSGELNAQQRRATLDRLEELLPSGERS